MKWLVRLYPRAWRDRYGDELVDLLGDVEASPGVALDVVRGAAAERLRSLLRATEPSLRFAGGPSMTEHPWQRHPTAFAIVAFAIVAPSLLFITVSLLAYQLEVPGMAAVVDPILRAVTDPLLIDVLLLGAPFLAFLLAAVPLVGGEASRLDGEPALTIRVRLRPLNVAVVVLTVLVGGFLVGYLVTEFLLESIR